MGCKPVAVGCEFQKGFALGKLPNAKGKLPEGSA